MASPPYPAQEAIDPRIFRAYDIRGIAGKQIHEEACLRIGQAFGSELIERYSIEHPTVAVGRDARLSSPKLEQATIQGLLTSGCNVRSIGAVPSPVNYFAVTSGKLDAGVHVTASHNPPQDNGLKLCTRNAEAFSGQNLQKLRERITTGDLLTGSGAMNDSAGAAEYIQNVQNLFQRIGKGLSIGVDAGNGIAGPINCTIFAAVGCNVTELYTEPDGRFPNHPADPSKASTLRDLQQRVVEEELHVGFAFDGDGDRLGVVDERGTVRSADEILLLLAEDHLTRFLGAPIVFTVSNSGILGSEITAWGGRPVICRVGHSFVEQAMHEHGALLGGEQSGHFFCAENYFPFDDALVAALRILHIMQRKQQPLSALFARYPRTHQTPERRPTVPDEHKMRIVDAAMAHFKQKFPVITLDGVRIEFGDGAWAIIRYSNTSPCLSICMEARSPERLAEVEKVILEHLRTYPEISWEM